MKIRDWIILVLVALSIFLLTRGPGTTQVDPSVIRKARSDSAKYAKQIEALQSEIRRSNERTSDSIQAYQKKIKALDSLNAGQIDTVFIVRYGSPISSIEVKREVAKDLVRYDQTRMELTSCKNVNSLQARMLKVKDQIIQTDSIQIMQIPGMEKEIKRLKKKLFWTKVGSGAAVAAIILILV